MNTKNAANMVKSYLKYILDIASRNARSRLRRRLTAEQVEAYMAGRLVRISAMPRSTADATSRGRQCARRNRPDAARS
ncbi:hypothetical protein [Sphingomonas sp. KR3-1]|uniref:hypothetical protein n=1 Tax=Sphingomonas sp. KR3-1 TaxID=3156611 RepID=UPI0032B3B2E4